jgi:acyl-CoA synthetase (AMP-forming)/AMP-acid ligase II
MGQDGSTMIFNNIYLARYLLDNGIAAGDRVAILAGNRVEYASVFFACMRIGAILVILNNTYTSAEAQYALQYTGVFEKRTLYHE